MVSSIQFFRENERKGMEWDIEISTNDRMIARQENRDT
jgi:hypothetical protein